MKLEFERPDYCQNCKIADLDLITQKMFTGDKEPYEIWCTIQCKHDAACKRIFDKIDGKKVKQ